MESAVQIASLSVSLGSNFIAINDISVDLPKGKIIGFIGPSGAGKTTLIRSIVGRQQIKQGSITVLRLPAGSSKLRHQVTYMTQGLSVYPDLTVRQNIVYFAIMADTSSNDAKAIATQVLKAVDLTDRADYLVSNLSGGQKTRLSLAIALIGNPSLMVLDEPTVGLDPVLREQLWKLFYEIGGRGTTLIISSHVMDEASRCQDLVLIRAGKLLAHDSPHELCRKTGTKSVEEAYIKLVGDKA